MIGVPLAWELIVRDASDEQLQRVRKAAERAGRRRGTQHPDTTTEETR